MVGNIDRVALLHLLLEACDCESNAARATVSTGWEHEEGVVRNVDYVGCTKYFFIM